jgi:hypothetical protein
VQRPRGTHGKSKFAHEIVSGMPCDAIKATPKSWAIAKQTIQARLPFSIRTGNPSLESHTAGQGSAGVGAIERKGLVNHAGQGDLSMRGHERHRAGSVGLTDQTSRDLYGIVAPRQFALSKMPVRIKRVCLGVAGGESPLRFPILDNTECVRWASQ